jgi:hypothetical protein
MWTLMLSALLLVGALSEQAAASCPRVTALETEVSNLKAAQSECCSRLTREINEIKSKIISVPTAAPTAAPDTETDCGDLLKRNPKQASGVYNLRLPGVGRTVSVYCDMDTAGGGWTVFQRRQDGTVNFYRNYKEYTDGFGKLDGEFWLGNSILSAMTRKRTYRLRVELEDFGGKKAFEEFSDFRLGTATEKFKIESVGIPTGTAGDSLSPHFGRSFSTFDEDNDISGVNCAQLYKGGWWYGACHTSNLNGEYNNKNFGQGTNWVSWAGHTYFTPMKTTEMKIRHAGY